MPLLTAVYQQMRSPYGFSYGVEMPEGIEQVRDIIVKLVNDGLPNTSKMEAYAISNPPGASNWCMIGYRYKDTKTNIGRPLLTKVERKIGDILHNAWREGWTVHKKVSVFMDKVEEKGARMSALNIYAGP